MDELPPWIVMQSDNAVLREVVTELLRNQRFRAELEASLGGRDDRAMFPAYIGGLELLEQLNAARPRNQQVRVPSKFGAVTAYSAAPDARVDAAGIVVDVDRIHRMAPDSAAARDAVRDAVLHEFAHLSPVAAARSSKAALGDPKMGAPAADHPVIQGENRLRGLFNLPAKQHYGLFGGR